MTHARSRRGLHLLFMHSSPCGSFLRSRFMFQPLSRSLTTVVLISEPIQEQKYEFSKKEQKYACEHITLHERDLIFFLNAKRDLILIPSLDEQRHFTFSRVKRELKPAKTISSRVDRSNLLWNSSVLADAGKTLTHTKFCTWMMTPAENQFTPAKNGRKSRILAECFRSNKPK